jgi:hypothetical protein
MKKSTEIYNQILSPVNSKYGAPMGRDSNLLCDKPTDERIFNRAVYLNQGYDKGGAYWGFPNNLRVEYNSSLSYVRFYRLESEAQNRVRNMYLNANI